MNATRFILAAFTGLSFQSLLAEGPLDDLKARFAEKQGELRAPLATLGDNYEKQLHAYVAEVQGKGDLQTVLKLQEEIAGFRDGNFSLPDVYTGIPRLGELRAIYHRHYWEIRDRIRDPEIELYQSYLSRLTELQSSLTKDGRTDAAVETGAEIETSRSVMAGLEALKRWKGRNTFEKTVLWELRDRYDLVENGNLTIKQEGGAYLLASDDRDGARVETKASFRPPLRIIVRAGTDSTNVRFYYAAGPFVIFNWEVRPDELRVHDPVSGSSPMAFKGKGGIEAGTMHDLEMRVTETRVSVYVNGALRGSRQGDFAAANGPVGIGPAFGSVVSLEAMAVFAED